VVVVTEAEEVEDMAETEVVMVVTEVVVVTEVEAMPGTIYSSSVLLFACVRVSVIASLFQTYLTLFEHTLFGFPVPYLMLYCRALGSLPLAKIHILCFFLFPKARRGWG
jgi:hypothetical protein